MRKRLVSALTAMALSASFMPVTSFAENEDAEVTTNDIEALEQIDEDFFQEVFEDAMSMLQNDAENRVVSEDVDDVAIMNNAVYEDVSEDSYELTNEIDTEHPYAESENEDNIFLMSSSAYYPEYKFNFDASSGTITEVNQTISGNFEIPAQIDGTIVNCIGESAFAGCSDLKNVIIPESVTLIGDYAFEDCTSLTNITIPESVTSIGEDAFSWCSNLTNISIPDSVRSIGVGAFDETGYYNNNSNWENNVLYINNCLICARTTIKGSFTIKDGTRLIAEEAFWGCEDLTEVKIPSSVNIICSEVFGYCNSLKTILMQNGVKSIGDMTFYRCSSLTDISIPKSVTSIGEGAFEDCSCLTSIAIPDSITSISSGAFLYCNRLVNITIPESVTSIGEGAFAGCTSLTNITIPESVTSIGEGAFEDCSCLTNITIPESVTSIGEGVFRNCNSFKTAGPIGHGYNYEFGWIESIPSNAFSGCAGLKEVMVPDSVKNIGERSFVGCSNLTNIKIPESVTSIDKEAFMYCNNLSTITIPKNVTSIGSCAFEKCINLTKVDFSAINCTSDSSSFFYDCTALTTINIGASVSSVPIEAFRRCSSLTNINVNGGNVYYSSDHGVLFNNDKSKLVLFPRGNKIGTYSIPKSVISIEERAFENCGGLTSVIIPDSVTSIGSHAFEDCSALKDVYYDGTEAKWNNILINNYNDELYEATIHFTEITTPMPTPTENIKTDSSVSNNSLGITHRSMKTISGGSDTLRGPKITILGKSFYLFEMPIDMQIKTPLAKVKYNADKEKFEITLGKLDKTKLQYGNDDKNETYHEIKEFVNYCGKSTTTETWNRYQHLQKALKADNMSFGFSFNATPAGYMEFDKNGKLLEGSIVYILNMDYNVKTPIPAAPIIYVKVGLGIDATGKLGIKSVETNGYAVFGSVGLDVSPYVGVGVGSSKIVNVEGGAKLKLATKLEIATNKKLKDAFTADMTGSLYFKFKALSFINFDKKWDIAKVAIYPNFGADLMSLQSIEDLDDMIVLPRDYADEPSEFVANDNIRLMSIDNIDTSTFKTNVYPYTEPQLVKLNNGKELLVWIDNDNSRTDINCSVLKYSINNGGTWSAPADVYNNGTADYSPKLAVTSNGAAVVWQKANKTFSDSTEYSAVAENTDLYYSEFNGTSWSSATKLTDNNAKYEFGADIASDGTNITVTWLENSDNDCFAITGTNNVYSITNDGTWGSVNEIASEIGMVTGLGVTYIDSEPVITYTEDKDGDNETTADVELYEYSGDSLSAITEDEVVDYGLTMLDNGYAWVHDNQLWERSASGVELLELPVNPLFLNNVKIMSNGDDRVVVWEQSDDYKSDLYAIYYDSDDNTWGEPVRLTNDNKKIRESNGYLTSDGAIRMAFGQAEVNEDAEDVYGRCNLMLTNITENTDIEVTAAGCSYIDYTPNEDASIWASVQNNSSSKIRKFNVTVTSGGSTVAEQTVDAEVASGATETLEIPYTLPADLSHKTYTVNVTPAEKTDDDLSNNSVDFSMGFADVTVAAQSANGVVSATVSNIGCLSADNVICTLAASDGTVLETKTLNTLAVNANEQVVFTENSEGTVVSVTTDSEENLYANNTVSVSEATETREGVYIILGECSLDGTTLTVTTTVTNSNSENKTAAVIVATYKDGAVQNVKSENIELNAGQTKEIPMEFNNVTDAEEIKIFLWNSLEGMTPYDMVGMDIEYPEAA